MKIISTRIRKEYSLLLISYSEAFIAVIPYITVMALAILLSSFIDLQELQHASQALNGFFPFILLISISSQLAKRYKITQLISISLSLGVFVCVEASLYGVSNLEAALSSDGSIFVLIIPIITIKLLLLITPKNLRYAFISIELNSSIKYIYSTIIILITVSIFLILIKYSVELALSDSQAFNLLSNEALMIARLLIDHILWFFGIHGSNLFDATFGRAFLTNNIFNSLTYKQFYDLFVIFGGSGAGLSLLLALFIAGKDKQSQKIARLATPFVIFNINEILIFGIPIIFNKYLLFPFVFVPCINLIISYSVLSFYPIQIINTDITWVTPIFVNAYLATGGDLFIIALQLLLLIIGILIYIPFIKAYTSTQSFALQSKSLTNKLNLNLQLSSGRELSSHQAKKDIIQTNLTVSKIIDLISEENLMVFYQPKVNVKDELCDQFEALLRIKMPDGSIRGPFFLDQLEIAGQASIIDIWVCQQVSNHMKSWEEKGLNLKVSVNLHPDTLGDSEAVSQILNILSGQNIDFEIIERGLLDANAAIKNIGLLKENGFSISIDDFGTGYSSFEVLCSLPIDCLKIDKSLIDLIDTPKGFIACKHITELCQDMGFSCVAEGVETHEQYELIARLNIKYIQGYYYSPAFSANKVESYKIDH